MRLARLIFLFIFAVTIAGCGYTSASLLPPELDSIYVENFANDIMPTREVSNRRSGYSYYPGLEIDITRAIINDFIFDRSLDIRTEKDAALTLKGALVDFRQSTLSYDDDDNLEEIRLYIYVNIELYNNLTGKTMWKEDSFMGQSDYNVTGPNAKAEDEALRDAVKDLAERIVERVIEAW